MAAAKAGGFGEPQWPLGLRGGEQGVDLGEVKGRPAVDSQGRGDGLRSPLRRFSQSLFQGLGRTVRGVLCMWRIQA